MKEEKSFCFKTVKKMANCIIPAHYPNQIDITRTPLAYGARAVPRLVSKFLSCQLNFSISSEFILQNPPASPLWYTMWQKNFKNTNHPIRDSIFCNFLITITRKLCVFKKNTTILRISTVIFRAIQYVNQKNYL